MQAAIRKYNNKIKEQLIWGHYWIELMGHQEEMLPALTFATETFPSCSQQSLVAFCWTGIYPQYHYYCNSSLI